MSRTTRFASVLLIASLLVFALTWALLHRGATRQGTDIPDSAEARPSYTSLPEVESPPPKTSDRSRSDGRAIEPQPVAPASVEVRVVDPAGLPLPGATIHAFDDATPADSIADAAGLSRISLGSKSREYIHLLVELAGRPHVNSLFETKGAVEVTLPAPLMLRGRVLDAESGNPLGEATIVHVHHDRMGCARDTIDCAPDGTFELPMLPAGDRVRLQVGVPGGPVERFTFRLETGRDAIERAFLLRRGVEVHGVVADVTEGSPVPDAVLYSPDREVEIARTDPAGRFRCRILPSEFSEGYVLGVGRPGYCPLKREWSQDAFDGSSPIRIPLARSSPIEGVVHDPAGHPLAGLELYVGMDLAAAFASDSNPDPEVERSAARWRDSLEGWHADDDGGGDTVTTDGEGRFACSTTPPWLEQYMVFATPFGRGLLEHRGVRHVAPGETTRLELVTRPRACARIRGRLLLNGSPVAGDITWEGPTRRGGGEVTEAGEYTLDFVEPGEITVHTGRRTLGLSYPQLAEDYTLTVVVDETIARDFDLVVPMQSISGRVTSTRGAPVPELELRLQSMSLAKAESFLASTRTDVEGRWSVDVRKDLEPYSVRLTGPGILIERETLAGTSNVDFVIPPIARFQVRVRDARTKQPVQKASISWCPAGSTEFHDLGPTWNRSALIPSHDGWYSIELPEGRIDLAAASSDRGHLPGLIRDLMITSGGPEVRAEFELDRGLSLAVEFAPGQEPPSNGNLWLFLVEPSDWEAALRHAKETEARYLEVRIEEIDDVDVEIYDFEQTLDRRRFNPRTCHVVPGRPVRVEGLPPGRYHLLAPSQFVTIEPNSIDLQEDGKTIQIRWKPRR